MRKSLSMRSRRAPPVSIEPAPPESSAEIHPTRLFPKAGTRDDSIRSGRLALRSLEDAREASSRLAALCPESDIARLGLLELFINAIEHGNLGIGFEHKAQLLRQGRWLEEIEQRLSSPACADKRAIVDYHRSETRFEVRIRDEGNGFDAARFLESRSRAALGVNGQGLVIARNICFDKLEFQGAGNIVEATIFFI